MDDINKSFIENLKTTWGKPLKIPKMTPIPEYIPSFQELAKQMRINVDILKQEISDHVDKEIARLKKEMTNEP